VPAAAWPTVADVKTFLRLGADTTDDALIGTELAAAIHWVSNRCVAQYVTPGTAQFLPEPLYSAALHEAGRMYRRRDSVDGTMGWGDMGVVRVGPKDPDIETMLAPYLNVIIG